MTMELLRQFKAYIQKHALFQSKDLLLLAVSGGVDSVVLCELCSRAGYKFTIAHCNFQLRGAESLRDENFVRSLGNKYSAEVLVKHFDTEAYAAQHKCSIQVAARELRYDWFKEIAPGYIVTAHHADDNIETVLMNFFKGTGIAGLRGILPKQGKIVRPLLFATKEAIKAFAADNKLDWVEDSSNTQDEYTRNFLRHQLLPVIREVYPQAESNIAANIGRFREIETLYRAKLDDILKKLIEKKGEELHIPILKLQKTNALGAILYELIHPVGFTSRQVDDALNLLQSETGRYIVSGTHRILKNRNWLIIAPLNTAGATHILIEKENKDVKFANGNLQLEHKPQTTNHKPLRRSPDGQTNSNLAELDASAINFPLLLRKWKPGDYFYPLGMRKKKKLARFFIDQKLSATDKEKAWVLEMDKKIIWVVGMRIDDRFRITDDTREVLHVEYSISV